MNVYYSVPANTCNSKDFYLYASIINATTKLIDNSCVILRLQAGITGENIFMNFSCSSLDKNEWEKQNGSKVKCSMFFLLKPV